jgi:hypothetical protein
MHFHDKIKELISLLEKWLPDPEDNTQIQQWVESADMFAYSFEFSEQEQVYVDRMIEMFQEQFKLRLQQSAAPQPMEEEETAFDHLEELLQRKQTEQRTPEWYAQMATILSASELGNLFSSPRQRAKLVVSKTQPYQARIQYLAVPSDRMSAFDWGIRFEPVVKQIYEYKYEAEVKELGRMIHPLDPRCSASPDGLVYQCRHRERRGRLIEIKCPVTREVDDTIPKDYYTQMQMQLHVTGLLYCDYVEAVFSSVYNQVAPREGPELFHGCIALVQYSEVKNGQPYYYIYSPINCGDDWQPMVQDEEQIVEIIPWRLLQWNEQLVKRSEEWWLSLQPIMEVFWQDVEKARRGEFTIPESTRAPKRKKEEVCQIIFQKLDEHGQKIDENVLEIESPLKRLALPNLMPPPMSLHAAADEI